MASPRIVLVHATTVALDPIHAAFASGWPEAETVNLLDDGLTSDRAKEDDLSDALIERFVTLCRYGHASGADGLLVTCSAFGPAIERAAGELPIPVLKPNVAMFEDALASGDRLALVVTFPPARSTMEVEFADEVARLGADASLTTIMVPDAMTALRAGDADTHNRLIAERADELAPFDAVMLAHFSTSRAAAALRAAVSGKVLTAPDAAVAKMKRLVAG